MTAWGCAGLIGALGLAVAYHVVCLVRLAGQVDFGTLIHQARRSRRGREIDIAAQGA